jgi:hypothetical protein
LRLNLSIWTLCAVYFVTFIHIKWFQALIVPCHKVQPNSRDRRNESCVRGADDVKQLLHMILDIYILLWHANTLFCMADILQAHEVASFSKYS